MLQIGSPPPTLACPFCPRHFHSKGGRTKHIRIKHHENGPNPHVSNLTVPSSPVPSSPNSSSHNVQLDQPPSPVPPDPSSSPLPLHGEVNTADNFSDIDIDAEHPQLDLPPDLNVGDESNENLPPGDNPLEQHGLDLNVSSDDESNEDLPSVENPLEQHSSNPPHITYTYHPKLNGE